MKEILKYAKNSRVFWCIAVSLGLFFAGKVLNMASHGLSGEIARYDEGKGGIKNREESYKEKAPAVKLITCFFSILLLAKLTPIAITLAKYEIESVLYSKTFLEEYRKIIRGRVDQVHKLIGPNGFFLIDRKSKAVEDFLINLLMTVPVNFIFLIINIVGIKAMKEKDCQVHKEVMESIFVSIFMIYFIMSVTFQYLRGILLSHRNMKKDESVEILNSILTNKEILIMYEKIDEELERYDKKLSDDLFYHRLYWTSNDLIKIMKDLLLIFQQFIAFDNLKGFYNLQTLLKFIGEQKLEMKKFSENIEKLFIELPNISDCPIDLIVPEIPVTDHNIHQKSIINKFNFNHITITNFTYKYQEREAFLKLGRNVTIKAGEKVAITGFNGSGKSTLFKYFLGLVPRAEREPSASNPTENDKIFKVKIESNPISRKRGIQSVKEIDKKSQRNKHITVKQLSNSKAKKPGIFLNNVDLINYDLPFLRKKVFSYIPQETLLMDETVCENLDVLDPQIKNTSIDFYNLFDSSLQRKIDMIKCFLNRRDYSGKLLDFFEDILTIKKLDDCTNMQRQKISLLRALLQNNPVLLVDELTSVLEDDETDQFMDVIMSLNNTVIMITHNLKLIDKYDKVMFFDKDNTEMGTYTEMLKKESFKRYMQTPVSGFTN
ncbi:hypothetical protein NUSPORA_00622 [Nucleospora cyclopteri]